MKRFILQISADTLHVILHQEHKANGGGFSSIYWILAVLVILLILLNLRKVKSLISRSKPKEYKFSIPGFELSGDIQYTSIDQEVAWKIYIELITRVSANVLEEGTGILREALNSLYLAFGALRNTLKESGAGLAKRPTENEKYTVASLLLIIMNQHLRPFLSKWHPLLQEYESKKPQNKSPFEFERKWERNPEFRNEISKLKQGLKEYIDTLKSIAEGEQPN